MVDLLSDSVFWLLLSWMFIPPVFCFFLARSRHRSSLLWVIAGMIFGILTVILLYFLPILPLKKYNVHKDSVLNTKLKLYQTLEEMNEAKQKKL